MKFQKHNFIYILITAMVSGLLYSCNPSKDQEQNNQVTVSGIITNPTGDSVFIKLYKEIGWDMISHGSEIAKDGSFTLSFELQQPEPASFSDGKESTKMFLHPDDKINLTLDTEQFDESIKYTGTHAGENNYLAAKYLEDEKNPLQYWKLADSISADDYMNIYETRKATLKSLLTQYQENFELSKDFIDYENEEIEIDFATHIYLYIDMKRDRKLGFDTINIPLSFYKHINRYIEKEGPLSKSPLFEQFISLLPRYLIATNPYNPKTLAQSDSISINLITSKLKGSLKEKTLTNTLFGMLRRYDIDSYDKYKVTFDSVVNNPNYIAYLDTKYTTVKKELARGLPEGVILKNLNEEEYQHLTFSSLIDQYKGKVIYLDFWASWCGPCKAEMPHSLKMQEYFKGKDVVFVYISSDNNVSDWERMIKILQITGKHYRTSKAVRKEYNDLFDVKYIPRYVIIDKEGNIVDDNAKRPSDKEVYSEIEGLL